MKLSIRNAKIFLKQCTVGYPHDFLPCKLETLFTWFSKTWKMELISVCLSVHFKVLENIAGKAVRIEWNWF